MIKDLIARLKAAVSPKEEVPIPRATIVTIPGAAVKITAFGGGGGGSSGNSNSLVGGGSWAIHDPTSLQTKEPICNLRVEDVADFLRELSELSTKHGLKITRKYDEILIKPCQAGAYTPYEGLYGIEPEWEDAKMEEQKK